MMRPDPRLPKIVKEAFHEARRQNVSLGKLAKDSGYDRKTLYGLKAAKHSTRIETLIDLGDALGMELHWRKKTDHGNVSKARGPRERSLQETQGSEEALLP